jgi:CO/xanthine dehydrogenase Mo-binding subunit
MTILGRGNSDLLISSKQTVGAAADFVEVEVDKVTGDVRVLRAVIACDMGRALNRMVVEGQIVRVRPGSGLRLRRGHGA